MKVLGDIKGIINSIQGLEEYILTAAELGNIIKEFCEYLKINDDQRRKAEEHYQFSGSKNARIGKNVEKLLAIFATCNVNFNLSDRV